jgi:hypothetical protein
MSFVRGVFLFALLMLLVGILGSRFLMAPLFAQVPTEPTIPPATNTPRPTATASPTTTATPTPLATPTALSTPTALVTATPTATPTSGTVSLDRYWVGSPSARRGNIISIGYVIDNGTGRTQRIMLGASIKSARSLSWFSSISDPSHDVVAIVPPGVSTHIRYFTLPYGLRPGSYDVAWGLRDAATGNRDALVTAALSLRVTR